MSLVQYVRIVPCMTEDKMTSDDEIKELEIRVEKFISKIEEWMSTTTEYRKCLVDKIDDINIRLNNLPCKERKGIYDSITTQVKWMWAFISAIILVVVSKYFTHDRP